MTTVSLKPLVYGLAILFLVGGCAEVLETDLSTKQVQLVAPSNGVAIPDSIALTFAWDSVAGANKYLLQIASPSFDSIVQLIADTPVFGTFLYLPAIPNIGQYQWRVMASNSSSSTPFCTPWNFTIQ